MAIPPDEGVLVTVAADGYEPGILNNTQTQVREAWFAIISTGTSGRITINEQAWLRLQARGKRPANLRRSNTKPPIYQDADNHG